MIQIYYEFNPSKQRFAVEIGEPKKLERLDKIAKPRPNENIAMVINANVFDWSGNANDGYGEIEQDGKLYKPVAKDYPCLSFKDGKMTYGDVVGAQVGANLAMLLVLDGKIDIRNPAKMATGKDKRTAVGQMTNGNILFITVDSMTTAELAAHMLKCGCTIAFQCDSGGSTGYYDGKVLHDQGRAVAAALVAYQPIDAKPEKEVSKLTNLVIAYSQQKNNKCKMGDTEQDHMYTIAKALYGILSQDNRLNTYLIPLQNTGSDLGNLKASIALSNRFIKANGGKGYHLELHSDAGGYAKGASGLFVSENGKSFVTPIMEELTSITPTADVGIRKRDNLGALNLTTATAAIIEVSFHDEPIQAEWIHEYPVFIATSLAKGIYESLINRKDR